MSRANFKLTLETFGAANYPDTYITKNKMNLFSGEEIEPNDCMYLMELLTINRLEHRERK